jgi:hypothetical protein
MTFFDNKHENHNEYTIRTKQLTAGASVAVENYVLIGVGGQHNFDKCDKPQNNITFVQLFFSPITHYSVELKRTQSR